MKKFLSILLATALILSFTSCKKDKNQSSSLTSSVTIDNSSSNISSVETSSAASVSSEKVVSKQTKTSSVKKTTVPKTSVTTSKLTNGKTYSSVAEFIKDNQSTISELEAQNSNSMFTCKILDKNNYLCYEFTYISALKNDFSESDIDTLNQNLENQKSLLTKSLNEAKQEIPSLKGFIYEFYDAYNVLITSYTM